MRRHRSILIFAFCCLLATVAFSQTSPPSAADVISVSVIVADASDRAIIGLALKDFSVFEDQVEQTILSVKENTAAGDYTLLCAEKPREGRSLSENPHQYSGTARVACPPLDRILRPARSTVISAVRQPR